MTTQVMDATLFAPTHPDIEKRTSTSRLIFSAALLLAGILSFALVFEMHDSSSALSMLLMVLGAGLLLWGTFRLFWKSRELVYLPTGSVAKEFSLYFDLKNLEKLTEMLKSGSMVEETMLKSESSGNVRMDVVLSQDNKFAAVQLFQFVPYAYTAVTPIHYFTGSDAAMMTRFLAKCK